MGTFGPLLGGDINMLSGSLEILGQKASSLGDHGQSAVSGTQGSPGEVLECCLKDWLITIPLT